MTIRRPLLLIPAVIAAAGLTACAGAPVADPTPTTDAAIDVDGHGEFADAEEVGEPPLGLLSIDPTGDIGLLDLLTGDTSAVGSIGAPLALVGDGRYAFVTTADGVDVVDSGRWSWDHGDHFHYYLAEPRVVGSVAGAGSATVTTGMLSTAGSTGVFFADSGEAVLIDNEALSDGEIVEIFRIETDAGAGIVAPLHDGALVTDGDVLVFHDASGAATDAAAECVDAAGAITTRAALVVGCAQGALLAAWVDGAPAFESIPYPEGVDGERAWAFDARKGRSTVAGVAGRTGFWLLDTREGSWRFVATEAPLARISAVDDDEGHVVAIDADGRVRIYIAESGMQIAVTEPLITAVDAAVSLSVDGQRAYVNDPAAGVVYEIDYADAGRVARTLETPSTPRFVTEVGR